MFYSRNLLSGKRKYLRGLILLLFISVVCLTFNMTGGLLSKLFIVNMFIVCIGTIIFISRPVKIATKRDKTQEKQSKIYEEIQQ